MPLRLCDSLADSTCEVIGARLAIALLAIGLIAVTPARPVSAQELLLPEWDYEPAVEDSSLRRGLGRSADASYDFANDTISDTWFIARSPVDWRARGWLTLGAVAGITTGMIYLVDERVRDAARPSEAFEDFGHGIRYLGTGPGLAALTGGFAAAGYLFDRPKERETARLLLEASAAGYVFTLSGKYIMGRSRPGTGRGARHFSPFSGSLSMPSGEATSAFVMAGVITSQYPAWPVQLSAYSLATAVGAGRIALDGHWSSDVFLSAALGVAVSKAVVHFNRKRAAQRADGRAAEPAARHFVQLSTRAFRWTYRF